MCLIWGRGKIRRGSGKETVPAFCFNIPNLASRDALPLLPSACRFHFWKAGVALSLVWVASGRKAARESYSAVNLACFLVEGL